MYGGLHILSLDVRFQMFNAAFLHSAVTSEADFERRISMALVHFGARGIPWSFWLCDGLLPASLRRRAQSLFARYGLSLATHMPGMLAASLEPPARRLPVCQVREVQDSRALEDFRSIGSRCFRVPADWFAEVFDNRTPERLPFRAWVGYSGREPLATAATVATPDSLGIYNVATLPAFRQLGYAETIIRAAITAEDCGPNLPIVLQSTSAGLELYRRMGFETVTQFRVWVSE